MAQTNPNETRFKYQNSVESFIVTLRADSIELAAPGLLGGVTPQKQIFFDEVVAVYRYRQNDWKVLTIAFVIALLFGLLGVGIYASGSSWGGGLAWAFGLLLMTFYIHRGFVRKNDMVRVVSPTAIIEFPCPRDQVFSDLMSRLKVINAKRIEQPEPI